MKSTSFRRISEPMPWLIYHSSGEVVSKPDSLEQFYLPVDSLRKVETDQLPLSGAAGLIYTESGATLPKPEHYVSILTAPRYLITSEDVFDKVNYQELYEAIAAA